MYRCSSIKRCGVQKTYLRDKGKLKNLEELKKWIRTIWKCHILQNVCDK